MTAIEQIEAEIAMLVVKISERIWKLLDEGEPINGDYLISEYEAQIKANRKLLRILKKK